MGKRQKAGRRYAPLAWRGFAALSLFFSFFLAVSFVSAGTLATQDAAGGSISGFLWADGNGMLSTDWDGLYNGTEQPLAGYPVKLYAQGSLSVPLADTVTGADGVYRFEALSPGFYVVGIESLSLGGNEYLLPFSGAIAIDWNSDPLTAYSQAVEIADEDTAVTDINAGLRLPMGVTPAAMGNYEVRQGTGLGGALLANYAELDDAFNYVNNHGSLHTFTIAALAWDPDVHGFTLAAGKTVLLTSDGYGSWMLYKNAAGRHGVVEGVLTLDGIHLNGGALGGGIQVNAGGSLTIDQTSANATVIEGCTATSMGSTCGGGVYVAGGGVFTMHGGTIRYNNAVNGGGVYAAAGGLFTMHGGSIGWNFAQQNGGGVCAAGGTLALHSSASIECNGAVNGGGVCLEQSAGFDMPGPNAQVHFNWADYGCGVYVGGNSTFHLMDGNIYNNAAQTQNGITYGALAGGGVYVGSTGTLLMDGGSIGGGQTLGGNGAVEGGGVYTRGTFLMNSGLIKWNRGGQRGGGVYVAGGSFTMTYNEPDSGVIHENFSGDGGGVYVAGGAAFLMQHGSIIANETTTTAGATSSTYDGAGVYVEAGGLFQMGTYTDAPGQIADNTAMGSGGGVWNAGTFRMYAGGIERNRAQGAAGPLDGCGGGVYNQGDFLMEAGGPGIHFASLDACSITDNEAWLGGGVYHAGGSFTAKGGQIGGGKNAGNYVHECGGGLYMAMGAAGTLQAGNSPGGPGTGLGTQVMENEAWHNGGGVYMAAGSALTVKEGSGIEGSSAEIGGGAYLNAHSTLTLGDGCIRSNRATHYGGGVFIGTDGAFAMNHADAALYDNEAWAGGGVYVSDYGALTMNDGQIGGGNGGNRTAGQYGGGVLVEEKGAFTAYDGQIACNEAPSGGGIYTYDYRNLDIWEPVRFFDNCASYSVTPNKTYLDGEYPNILYASCSIFDHPINNYDINAKEEEEGSGFFIAKLVDDDNPDPDEVFTFTVQLTVDDGQGGFLSLIDWYVDILEGTMTPQEILDALEAMGVFDYTGVNFLGGAPPPDGTLAMDGGCMATFTLKHGQAILLPWNILSGLGVHFQVIESSCAGYLPFWEVDGGGAVCGGDTGRVPISGVPQVVFFTNKRPFTIGKLVDGAGADPDEAFTFTLYITVDTGGGTIVPVTAAAPGTIVDYAGISLVPGVAPPPDGTLVFDLNGAAVFTLKHGQAIALLNSPPGSQGIYFQVVESGGGSYVPSFEDSEGAGSEAGGDTGAREFLGGGRTLLFTNTPAQIIPTGVDGGSMALLPVMLAPGLLAGWALVHIRRRQRRWLTA